MTELTMIILVMNETAHSVTRSSWSVLSNLTNNVKDAIYTEPINERTI